MKRSKKGLFIVTIMIGFLFQSNTAWGNPLDRIHRTLLQNISITKTEREIFGKVKICIPTAKTQFTPLVPKGPGPAFSRTRETLLFNNFPKPENFDVEAFKADMEKLRGWVEGKIGKKAVDISIKMAKKIASKIKNEQERKKFKALVMVKIKEFVKNSREFVKAAPNREVSAPKLRLSVKRNLFDPDRKRFRPRKEFLTGFTGFRR